MKIEISKIKLINITKIDKWMVTPNLNLQTIKFTGKMIEDHLLELQKKLFMFEAKEIPDAPKVFVKLWESVFIVFRWRKEVHQLKRKSIFFF